MTTERSSPRLLPAAVLALALLSGIAAGAGSMYLSGSPDLVAQIEGTNEFSPGSGQDVLIHVRNTGVDEIKLVQPGGGAGGDPPSTARMVTLTLLPGDAPVEIKTEPQMVGDIASGNGALSTFSVQVDRDAAGGTYLLPLAVNYTFLASEDRVGSDSVILHYQTGTARIELPFRVRDEVRLRVRDVVAEDLNAGGEGYLTLSLENTGSLAGNHTIARIFREEGSPIEPIDGQVFIGSFPPGAVAHATFKVRVDGKAGKEEYPLNVAAEYTDQSGGTLLSPDVTIGIPVAGKSVFTLTQEPLSIYRGGRDAIEVEYRNGGETTVFGAQARISAVDPFMAYDDTAYLGDLAPGQSAPARFEIGADKAATLKEYGLDTEIRYRDHMDMNRISDPVNLRIEVKERAGLVRILYEPVLMSIIIAAGIGCGYYLFIHRKRKPEKPVE